MDTMIVGSDGAWICECHRCFIGPDSIILIPNYVMDFDRLVRSSPPQSGCSFVVVAATTPGFPLFPHVSGLEFKQTFHAFKDMWNDTLSLFISSHKYQIKCCLSLCLLQNVQGA